MPFTCTEGMAPPDQALVGLLGTLRDSGYQFVTPTPLTHQRVLQQRNGALAASLRDVFGWNMPFNAALLAPPVLALMQQAGVLQQQGRACRSAVRVASLEGRLYLHSSFPTEAGNAVFFGPDTYRFAGLIRDSLPPPAQRHGWRVMDIGCGSGAGGLLATHLCAGAATALNDINPLALRYAAINAAAAGVQAELALGDALASVTGDFDLIVSNPPYLVDDTLRAYRHGGDGLGRALSVRIAREALQRLRPGGRLVLYTGVAIVQGVDPFIAELAPALNAARCDWHYREIDPDVFGEELDRPVYSQCDRIAAVGLVVVKGAG